MKPVGQRNNVVAIVNAVLAPAEAALNWTDSDRNDFARDVERLTKLAAAENRENARELMINKLAFHFSTSMYPTEQDAADFRDVATTFVDEIVKRLPESVKTPPSDAGHSL